ncbi:hypothetical protein WDV06_29350 [Streptomyces racemochromogenes]|uniref:Terpene synthase n=1 Tax=Streptomyces racemochromogenes TaxID=67353 RepID=A0ABW7PL87_9ACTN
MPTDSAGAAPAPVTVLERSLADLWDRTVAGMTGAARAEFRATMADMLESWVWEVENRSHHRVPDPVDYAEMRRRTFGSQLTMYMCRLGHGGRGVPEEIYRSGTVRSLENAAADIGCLINDIFSYQKEVEFEGDMHNHLVVTRTFFDIGYPEALHICHSLMKQRVEEFQHIVANLLPRLCEDRGLDAEGRAGLDAYADELRDWLAGVLNWHRRVRRYGEDELRRQGGGALAATVLSSGFGMAAARIGLPV